MKIENKHYVIAFAAGVALAATQSAVKYAKKRAHQKKERAARSKVEASIQAVYDLAKKTNDVELFQYVLMMKLYFHASMPEKVLQVATEGRKRYEKLVFDDIVENY